MADNDSTPLNPLARSETTQADANPAFYPQEAKSEALHSEAEKAGLGYPGPVIEAVSGDPATSPLATAASQAQQGDQLSTSTEDGIEHEGGSTTEAPAGDTEATMPAKNASTEDWQAYAVSQGMSEEEAAGKGRDELVAQYATE